MQLHRQFLLIQQNDMMPEAEYWSDESSSLLSVPAGYGAVEMDNDGGCWYRYWDRTHGLSHEEELEPLKDSEATSLSYIIRHLRTLAEQINSRYPD